MHPIGVLGTSGRKIGAHDGSNPPFSTLWVWGSVGMVEASLGPNPSSPDQGPSIEGILKRYPEIGDPPKKVLSNPPEGSIKPLKKSSIEPPFGPQKGSIEPLWEGLQNHWQGSIEPFASNPPFSDYPFIKFSLFQPLDGHNRQGQSLGFSEVPRSTLAGHSAAPHGTNVARMNANRAIQTAEQQTRGLWRRISVLFGGDMAANKH